MIKLCLKIWRIFLSVLTSRSRSLTSVLIWIMTSCFSCNIHNYRLFYDECKLNADNFNVESWTISFKLELLSVILFHSVFEFDLFFGFTKRNWTFQAFELTLLWLFRAGNSNCRRLRRQKQTNFRANSQSSMTSY